MKRIYPAVLLLLAAGTITLTGCRGGSSSSPSMAPSPTAASSPCILKITAQSSDIYLDVTGISVRACNVTAAAAGAAQSSATVAKVPALPSGLASYCTYTTKSGRVISVYADGTDPVARQAAAKVCKDNGK